MTKLPSPDFAVIGGSGLTSMPGLQIIHRQLVRTPWGEPSGPVTFGELGGRVIAFLPRHGQGHTIAPHLVNYRANMHALAKVGVQRVIGVAAVGGIHENCTPGRLVIADDLIDYTWGRAHSYFEGGVTGTPVNHVDFTHPYCAALRQALTGAVESAKVDALDGGVYAATQGPRFETPAEIRRLKNDGGDVVGMTGMPEAGLARELGMCYANLSVVVNPAAGLGAPGEALSLEAIFAELEQGIDSARRLIETAAGAVGDVHCTRCGGQ